MLLLTNFSFLEEDWTLGYNYLNLLDFSDIMKFPKILSFESFGNLWDNSYTPVYY